MFGSNDKPSYFCTAITVAGDCAGDGRLKTSSMVSAAVRPGFFCTMYQTYNNNMRSVEMCQWIRDSHEIAIYFPQKDRKSAARVTTLITFIWCSGVIACKNNNKIKFI